MSQGLTEYHLLMDFGLLKSRKIDIIKVQIRASAGCQCLSFKSSCYEKMGYYEIIIFFFRWTILSNNPSNCDQSRVLDSPLFPKV